MHICNMQNKPEEKSKNKGLQGDFTHDWHVSMSTTIYDNYSNNKKFSPIKPGHV